MNRKRIISAAVSPLLVFCLAVPASAAVSDTDINVKGKYNGSYAGMATLILKETNTLALGGGQTMSAVLTNRLDEEIRMVVTPVLQASEAEAYAWLAGETARTGMSPYAYHFGFYDGATSTGLEGEAIIRLTIPSGYASASFYYMDNEGNLTAVRTQKSGNTISFTAQTGGYYLFLKPLSGGSSSDESDDSGSLPSSASSASSSSSLSGSSSTGIITIDSVKGRVNSLTGIITGAVGGASSDGYSHWVLDEKGWRLRYADGSWAGGSQIDGTERYHWEKTDGAWYVFGADNYALFGWVYDQNTAHWYYLDVNTGMDTGWHKDAQDGRWYYLDVTGGQMLTGWQRIGGKWYFFNDYTPEATWEYNRTERAWKYKLDSTGRPYGSMYENETTPDGHFVDENGVWDGKTAQ
ncbi:MAG: hypothetical protein Q4E24_07935 [bacterium]|nr:hypothetical protein [bacterium]